MAAGRSGIDLLASAEPADRAPSDEPCAKRCRISEAAECARSAGEHFVRRGGAACELASPIIVERCPSLEEFLARHLQPRVPLVIIGAMDDWPALSQWSDMGYIKEKAGSRLVPVELGRHYLDDNWSQTLMPMAEFIESHIEAANARTGYLAQHALFEQIAELQHDIIAPFYTVFHRCLAL